MTDHGESGAAGNGGPVVRVQIDEADELAAAEMESYARAWAQSRAAEAAYVADRRSLAEAMTARLNDTIPLPEGMRFEWMAGDVPPGYFRAAAGNLVREDDPLAVAFRAVVEQIVYLGRALAPLADLHRARVSAMHRDYRRRQLARHRRR